LLHTLRIDHHDMEIRGNAVEDGQKTRPAISRRSGIAMLELRFHTTRMHPHHRCKEVNTTKAKNIDIGTIRKIDDIARDIFFIKSSLGNHNVPKEYTEQQDGSGAQTTPEKITRPVFGNYASAESHVIVPQWDHSFHVIDFVKAFVEDSRPDQEEEDSSETISSLRSLVDVMSNPVLGGKFPLVSESDLASKQTHARLPSLDAVLEVLRWTKSHQNYLRVKSISQILPLQKFEDTCRKVYFAVDNYSEIDFVLTAGFLSYMFAEHTISEGISSSRDHFQLCQRSLARALSLLPIMLPPTMEVIAALTLGTLFSVENSKAITAWSFISTALNHCQTLGYHRLDPQPKGHGNEQGNMEISLFWAVFKFEKGLALRLGRPSGIRDAEITLLAKPDEHRTIRIARIQGQIYDQLYSPAGLPTLEERKAQAMQFADEVRDILTQIKSEISAAKESLKDAQADPMRATYLHSDLVCHSSILTLILRAIPSAQRSEISDECASAARDTLEAHQQCIQSVRGCSDPATVVKYLNWAIIHVPFVPFSIIFTCVVRTYNFEDLALLERFAASLKPDTTGENSPTHPYRLYNLLCQAARLYITRAQFSASGLNMSRIDSTLLTDFEASQFFAETEGPIEEFGNPDLLMCDASDWYQGNQQLINLLDEGRLF
ncbi:fungal specific transcription factor, partial [Colletotrichum incanum]